MVSEVVRHRIPGHLTSNGERPTAERAATMSWYDKMVAAGRSKSLTTGKRPMWGGSSSRGTGEPCLGDTGVLSVTAEAVAYGLVQLHF